MSSPQTLFIAPNAVVRPRRRHRHRHLPLALCAAFTSMPLALPVMAAEDREERKSLPTIEIRSERAPFDPRPGKLSSATRVEADVRDIPQSIDSVDMAQVGAYGAQSLAEALLGVPGVSNSADTRFDGVKIRGYASVGDLFLDGVRDDAQYARSLGNIERIEVLKGPAAVLYGRGSGGGVINRISKQPGADVQSSLTLQAGSAGRIAMAADVNQVLSEQWAMRINAGRERMGSFRDHVGSARQYLAPSLKWNDGATSWLLQAEAAEYDRTPDRGMPAARRADGQYLLPPAAWSATYGVAGRDYVKDTSASLRSTLEQRLTPDWKLRHTLGMLHINSIFDNTYATGLGGADNGSVTRQRWQQDMHQRNWQSNLELEGKLASGGLQHQLLLGAEYSVQRRQPTLLARSPAGPVSLLAPSNADDRRAAPVRTIDNLHRADGVALYAQDQLQLAPDWIVLGGVRWDRFSVDSSNRMAQTRVARTTTALSPRLGVVWKVVPGHSSYVSYSKNFIPSGGADAIALAPGSTGNANDLPPQFSRQLELGLKSDWLDGRLSTTLALFQLDLTNRRTRIQQNPDVFALSGLERNRGIELGVSGEVAPSWFIRGGFSAQRARVLKSSPQDGLAGKRPTNVAGANGSLFLSLAPALGTFGELGLVYEGSRYADTANRLDLPAYVRWDGKLGYRLHQAELTLAVTNLTNRRYFSTATSVTQVMPGAPRSWLASVAYRF